MKKLTLLIMVFVSLMANAQLVQCNINEKMYRWHDTLTIGNGSGINGTFLFIQEKDGSAMAAYKRSQDVSKFTVTPECSGAKVIIKEISRLPNKEENIYFIVKRGTHLYYVFIEQALKNSEIKKGL